MLHTAWGSVERGPFLMALCNDTGQWAWVALSTQLQAVCDVCFGEIWDSAVSFGQHPFQTPFRVLFSKQEVVAFRACSQP